MGECTNIKDRVCLNSAVPHSAAAASGVDISKEVDISTMEPLPVILRSYSWHQCQRFVCLNVKVPGLPDREASCVSCEFTADTFKLKVCPVKQQQSAVTPTSCSCGDDHNPNGIARKKKIMSRAEGTRDKCRVSYVLFINNLARKVNPDGCSYRIKTDEVRVKLAKLVPDEWLAVTATEDKELRRKVKEDSRMKSFTNKAGERITMMVDPNKVINEGIVPKKLQKKAPIPSSFEESFLRDGVIDVEKMQMSAPCKVSPFWTVTRPCDVQPAIHSSYYARPELVRIAMREKHGGTLEFATFLEVLSQYSCCVLLRCLDSFIGCHASSYELDYIRLALLSMESRTQISEFWGCLQERHISFLPNGLRRLGLAVQSKADYDLLIELRPFPNLDAIGGSWKPPANLSLELIYCVDLMVQRSVAPASLCALPARYTTLTLRFRGLADHDMEWMMIVLTRVSKKRKPSLCLQASLLTAKGARVLARRLSNFRLKDIRIEAPLLSLGDRGLVEKLFVDGAGCPCYWSTDLMWGRSE